jgi:hypothetical protein
MFKKYLFILIFILYSLNFVPSQVFATSCTDYLSVSPKNEIVSKTAGYVTPIVYSNKSWKVSSSSTYLTIKPGVFYFNVDYSENLSSLPRTATVTVTQYGCALPMNYKLTQSGSYSGKCADSITLSKDHEDVTGKTGSTSSINVYLGSNSSSWTTVTSDPWLIVTNDMNTNSFVVHYNDTQLITSSRTGVVTVKTSCDSVDFYINQYIYKKVIKPRYKPF